MKVSSLCPLGVSWRNVAKKDLRICFRPHYSAQGEKSRNSKATNRATTKSARKKAQSRGKLATTAAAAAFPLLINNQLFTAAEERKRPFLGISRSPSLLPRSRRKLRHYTSLYFPRKNRRVSLSLPCPLQTRTFSLHCAVLFRKHSFPNLLLFRLSFLYVCLKIPNRERIIA